MISGKYKQNKNVNSFYTAPIHLNNTNNFKFELHSVSKIIAEKYGIKTLRLILFTQNSSTLYIQYFY